MRVSVAAAAVAGPALLPFQMAETIAVVMVIGAADVGSKQTGLASA